VGLSIIEATAVHPSSVLGLIGYEDSVIPMYAKLMDTVRPLGMRVFQQLWHGGHIYPPPGGLPMRGASALPGPVAGMPAVPIGTEEPGRHPRGQRRRPQDRLTRARGHRARTGRPAARGGPGGRGRSGPPPRRPDGIKTDTDW
jgi:hypothetical protein